MGAWGFGLFQSDWDLDLIGDLDSELGLYELARKASAAAAAAAAAASSSEEGQKENQHPTYAEEHDDAEDDLVGYSIFANDCFPEEAIGTVKEFLESGKLAELVAKYEEKMHTRDESVLFDPPLVFDKPEYHRPRTDDIHSEYKLCLLGACAMTHGCHLEPSFVNLLKRIYHASLRMPDKNMQMTKALYGPNGYINGVAYDFGSKGLVETANSDGSPEEDLDRNLIFGRPRSPSYPEPQYPDHVCGACGKDENAGMGPLMKCACCKNRVYCSKECQKYHWKWHKAVCKPA
ncbi:hypothetical protein KC351_g13634 [Hortaea werneckii]|nr:hypothetical protein KC351_g13634 [Hortaea werneckii]